MKVKCIRNDGWSSLTINKTYEIIDEDIYYYLIIDDIATKHWFGKFMFKPLSEYRNDTINKLLEE